MEKPVKSLLRTKGKTVYLLGAGFSRPGGGLIMSNFGTEAFRYLKDKSPDLAEVFARVINKQRAICEILGLNVYNIEHLFSLVDMPGSKEEDTKGTRNDLIRIIIVAAEEAFRQRCQVGEELSEARECVVPYHLIRGTYLESKPECKHNLAWGACVYEAFLCKILSDQHKRLSSIQNRDDLDTVITLNWDLLLERKIHRFKGILFYYGDGIVKTGNYVIAKKHRNKEGKNKEGYDKEGYDKKGFKVIVRKAPTTPKVLVKTIQMLKIHGSFNWRRDSKVGNEIVERWDNIDNFLKSVVEGELPPMILPTWRRESREDDIFSRLADLAIQQLRSAEKIVVIGYSMPETDAYFRYLMARGLETAEFPVVEVWDIQPEEAMKNKLVALFGQAAIDRKRVTYSDKGLLGFVKSHPFDLGKENQ